MSVPRAHATRQIGRGTRSRCYRIHDRVTRCLALAVHWGDGSDDIIELLDAGWVRHYSAGAHWQDPGQAERFLREIPRIVEAMSDCAVVLYQAGADPHIDDPLGGWLTTEQLRERDRLVFETARRYGIPIAWNLAGGYQEPLSKVLEIHDNTMRECAEGEDSPACARLGG